MKICPKCGQELVGDRCPRCDGPEIIVNNNEYLQRKKAYEEKQARQKSASSHSQNAENISAEQLQNALTQIKENSTAVAKKVREAGKKARVPGKPDKNLMLGIILVAVMLVITGATFGVYKLVTRRNPILYMSYNNKVYNVSSLDSAYVCDLSDAVFAADKKTFYIAEWPDEIDRSRISETCVSQNGKYFTATTYDAVTYEYALYAWSDEGSLVISRSKLKKNVKTITDNGVVIYTDVEVLNEEGYTGTSSLNICKLSVDKSQEKGERLAGNVFKLESSLRSAYVYSDSNLVICYTTSEQLYTYDYKKGLKTNIADHVEAIYPMSDQSPYLYASQIMDENTLSEADSLIYQLDGTYIYYNLEHETRITIGKQTGANLSFIYEKKNACMYVISASSIQYAEIKDDKPGKFTEVDRLGNQQNLIYVQDDSRILYVNASNQLMSMNKGTSKLLREEVMDGSVTRVGNTSDGITYIVGQTQFYRSSPGADEVAMYSDGSLTDTSDTYLYKNRLYFYNSAKELHSCTLKGKDENKIGQVDSLWLG